MTIYINMNDGDSDAMDKVLASLGSISGGTRRSLSQADIGGSACGAVRKRAQSFPR